LWQVSKKKSIIYSPIYKKYSLLLYIAPPSRSPDFFGIYVEECNLHSTGLNDRHECGKDFIQNVMV